MACGPKYMACVMVFSVWGTLFMAVLGVFFTVNSGLLIEDITLPSTAGVQDRPSAEAWWDLVSAEYSQQGSNCFIAAALYVVTGVAAFFRFRQTKSRL